MRETPSSLKIGLVLIGIRDGVGLMDSKERLLLAICLSTTGDDSQGYEKVKRRLIRNLKRYQAIINKGISCNMVWNRSSGLR